MSTHIVRSFRRSRLQEREVRQIAALSLAAATKTLLMPKDFVAIIGDRSGTVRNWWP